jgi:hypothetical protein
VTIRHYNVESEGVLYDDDEDGCEHHHEQYREGHRIEIRHDETAHATDSPRLPDRPGLAESIEVTDSVGVELIQTWRHQSEQATATDAARRRHTVVGTGTSGWESEVIQHPFVAHLDPSATVSFVIQDYIERRLTADGVARFGNPRGRSVRLKVTLEPDPYLLPIAPIVIFDAPLVGVGFTDIVLPVSEEYERYLVTLTNLEIDRVSEIHVLITGWSARESKNPARYPEPGV